MEILPTQTQVAEGERKLNAHDVFPKERCKDTETDAQRKPRHGD
jgi:hypothetical protein